MTIKRTRTPPRKRIDGAAIARFAGPLIVGHKRERVADGRDIDGRTFLPYSEGYATRRIILGRASAFVDLLMSGGLMGSLKVLEVTEREGVASVVVGLGTGVSRIVRPPPKRRRKARGKRRTHGPPHNLLGRWHQDGAGNNPRRKWFGVSRDGQADIMEILRRMIPQPPLR